MRKHLFSLFLLSLVTFGLEAQEKDIIQSAMDGSFFQFPQIRESVCKMRNFFPTKSVVPSDGKRHEFITRIDNRIDDITFQTLDGKTMTWSEALDSAYADGVIILHRGRIVYEKYFAHMDREKHHALMSVSKTFTGTLGAILVAEGVLDQNKRVAEYVPELAASAFGDATVRDLLDMTTALKYSEDYDDPKAEVWVFSAAGTPYPRPKTYKGPVGYHQYLETVKKDGEHGKIFSYKTINTDALAWVITRVTGKSLSELLSEKIWKKIGSHYEAYYQIDATGTEFAGGGLNANLRDVAAFGQMMLDKGRFMGEQIIPQQVYYDIINNSDSEKFDKAHYPQLKGWAYRNMWWCTKNRDNAFCARGVHGQCIYVNPAAEVVIVRIASHPVAANAANDRYSLPAYQAVADYFRNK